MHLSFLRFRDGFYLKFSLLLASLSLLAYLVYDPLGSHNGGTWLGYTLGTTGTILILWLTLFGVRKRAYSSRMGSLQGWLSAHVYLGMALVVIATLHTGFQFGGNIHTLAWLLMMGVIGSGFWGLSCYLRYPKLITANRDNLTRAAIFREISELDRKASLLVEAVGSPVDRMVITSIQLFSVGGGLLAQLLGADGSMMMVPEEGGGRRRWKKVGNAEQHKLMDRLAQELASVRDPGIAGVLQELIDVIATKRALVRRLRDDIRMQGLLEIWLYIHIPLTLALLAALTAHIISVFFYW